MKLVREGSVDLIGDALQFASPAAADHTEDHPLTPALFWDHLASQGFSFEGEATNRDEFGRFFAHLVLDHAVATDVIAGNTAQHHYWPI